MLLRADAPSFADVPIPIALDGTDSGRMTGTLSAPGSQDVYRIIPPADGPLQVRMVAAPGGALDSLLELVDGVTGGLLTSNDDTRGSTDSLVGRRM